MLDNFTAQGMYDRMIRTNFQEELDLIAEAADAGEESVIIPVQSFDYKQYGLLFRQLDKRGFTYSCSGYGHSISREKTIEVSWTAIPYASPSREFDIRTVLR